MLTLKSFALSLSALFIYSVSFAMEEKHVFENVHNKPFEISNEHYNVFKAVQYIKKLYLEELDGIKDSIPSTLDELYIDYKKNINNLTLRYRDFSSFEIHGLVVHFTTDLEVLTRWGELNFTSFLKMHRGIGTNISNQNIAKFLRNFENKLLNHGELTIEESDRSSIAYKVHSINEIVLPEPIVTAHESTFYVTENSRKLWQAMEEKYKEENNQLS